MSGHLNNNQNNKYVLSFPSGQFSGQLQFNEIRKNILRLGIEMATSAQRDRFVENPVEQVFELNV